MVSHFSSENMGFLASSYLGVLFLVLAFFFVMLDFKIHVTFLCSLSRQMGLQLSKDIQMTYKNAYEVRLWDALLVAVS